MKYAQDAYMEEMGDSARVWSVSNDESERTDTAMINGWLGSLDSLFLFVGGMH